MVRKKVSASPQLPERPRNSDITEFRRLVQSLHYPLSPEGKRVLAAAKVGLRLIQERTEEVKRAKRAVLPQLHVQRQKPARAVAGGTPLCENKLPSCIQEMLAKHRLNDLQN